MARRSRGRRRLIEDAGKLGCVDQSRDALEDALTAFAGCAVIISHDGWFLGRIATHILAVQRHSQVVRSERNFQDCETDKKRRLGADAEQQPHRIMYKPLVRG